MYSGRVEEAFRECQKFKNGTYNTQDAQLRSVGILYVSDTDMECLCFVVQTHHWTLAHVGVYLVIYE